MRQITFAPTFAGWQQAARRAVDERLDPGGLVWQELEDEHPAHAKPAEDSVECPPDDRLHVSRAFVQVAARVACHNDPRRWSLLYRVFWRLTHGEPRLIEIVLDPDVVELLRMQRTVRHDGEKNGAVKPFHAT